MASLDEPTPCRKDSPACAPAMSHTSVAKAAFSVGDEFTSFAALEQKVSLYSSTNNVQLWKRDARTIEGAKNRVGKIVASMSDALKYQSVRYCCIHGGKKFTSKAAERHGSTFKKDCPFNIYLAASKDGTCLQVRSLFLDHNHDVSEALYRHLPQKCKLPHDLEEKLPRQLLSGGTTIGHTSRPSYCWKTDSDNAATEPVHHEAWGLAPELGKAIAASTEPACQLCRVTDKSIQVRLPTHHEEASQANEKKLLSTSATQTEPQDASPGPLSSAPLKQSSPLAFVRGRLHSCQQCTYVTLDKSAMNIHLQRHKSEPSLQCRLCPAAFTHNSEFELHVLTHKRWRPFSSGHCNADFSQESALSDHMLTHTGERRFSCIYCNASFMKKASLIVHIRSHTGERPFCCDQCNASFMSKGNLTGHMRTHTGERPYCCDYCSASFKWKDHLVKHRRSHTGERPYSCVHCSASFTTKSYLTHHLRSHTGERPFLCVHCNASFSRKHLLLEHIRTHTGERPYSCVHCNASFRVKRRLNEHIRIHTGERPFCCVHCSASFPQKYQLVEHIRTHTGERPFTCVHCKASFMTKSHLIAHTRIHTGERPFSCVHCNASFKRTSHLKTHLQTHAR